MEIHMVHGDHSTNGRPRPAQEDEDPEVTHVDNPYNLPKSKMKDAKHRFNEKRERERQHKAPNTPFKPGQNTLERVPTRAVNESRQPLPASARSALRGQPPGRRVDIGQPQRTNFPPRQGFITDPFSQPGSSRLASEPRPASLGHRHSHKVEDDPEDVVECVPDPALRPRTRSRSPVKPASGGKALAADDQSSFEVEFLDTQQASHPADNIPSSDVRRQHTRRPSHPSSSPTKHGTSVAKGKGKLLSERSDTRPYRVSADSTSSGSEDENQQDPIKPPDGRFSTDVRSVQTSAKGKGKELVAAEENGPRHGRGRNAVVVDLSNPSGDTESSRRDRSPSISHVAGETSAQPKVDGLRVSRLMKRRDGTVPKQAGPKAASASATPKQSGTVQSSFSHVNCDAEVEKAWLSPDQVLKCHSLMLKPNQLQVYANIGPSGAWWTIEIKDITLAEICDHKNHPFVMMDVSFIKPNEATMVEAMMRSGGLRAMWSNSAQKLLATFRDRLIKGTNTEVISLDPDTCAIYRESCNSQTRNTRARAQEQKDEERRKTLEAAQRRKDEADARGRPKASRRSNTRDQEEDLPTVGRKDQQSKLNFQPQPPTRRSVRLSGADKGLDVDDDEVQHIEAGPSVSRKLPKGDKNELLFAFPPTGRADVNITYGDAQRLEEGEFLNDTLLEFGLRHVLSNLEAEMREQVHLFNSFFYDKLSNKSKKVKAGEELWPAYETVKKWSKGKDIFSKKFVVIPINEHFHWYLAVIVNPAGVLRPPPGRSNTEAQSATGQTAKAGSTSRSTSVDTAQVGLDTSHRIDPELNDLDSDPESVNSVFPAVPQLTDEEAGAEVSRDEIDFLHDYSMNTVSSGVQDISLGEDGEDSVGPGQPIMTPTLQAMQDQNAHLYGPHPEPAKPEPEPGAPAKKGRPPRVDAEIVDSPKTWILTFDSLGGPHRAVRTTLNQWLHYEAKDKLNHQGELSEAEYWEGRVPQQNNFYDCGLYVVHYAKQFLRRSSELLRIIQRLPPLSSAPDRGKYDDALREAWLAEEASNLRTVWIDMIIELASEYKAARPAATKPNGQNTGADDDGRDNDYPELGFPIAGIGADEPEDDSVHVIPASQAEREAATAQAEEMQVDMEVSQHIPGAFPAAIAEPDGSRPHSPKRIKSPSPTGSRSSYDADMDPLLRSLMPPNELPNPPSPALIPSDITTSDDERAAAPVAMVEPSSTSSLLASLTKPPVSAVATPSKGEAGQQRMSFAIPNEETKTSTDNGLKPVTELNPVGPLIKSPDQESNHPSRMVLKSGQGHADEQASKDKQSNRDEELARIAHLRPKRQTLVEFTSYQAPPQADGATAGDSDDDGSSTRLTDDAALDHSLNANPMTNDEDDDNEQDTVLPPSGPTNKQSPFSGLGQGAPRAGVSSGHTASTTSNSVLFATDGRTRPARVQEDDPTGPGRRWTANLHPMFKKNNDASHAGEHSGISNSIDGDVFLDQSDVRQTRGKMRESLGGVFDKPDDLPRNSDGKKRGPIIQLSGSSTSGGEDDGISAGKTRAAGARTGSADDSVQGEKEEETETIEWQPGQSTKRSPSKVKTYASKRSASNSKKRTIPSGGAPAPHPHSHLQSTSKPARIRSGPASIRTQSHGGLRPSKRSKLDGGKGMDDPILVDSDDDDLASTLR